MNGDDLGAARVAQELVEDGVPAVDVLAELRKRYTLDDHVAAAVVRYAISQSRRSVPRVGSQTSLVVLTVD